MKIRFNTFPADKRAELHEKRAYISLSLSNRISTSEHRLSQLLDWTSVNLDAFDVLIGDYFHRHNLESIDGLNPKLALSKAIESGREIAERIGYVLNRMGLHSIQILLASEIRNSPDFTEHLRSKKSLYDTNSDFRTQINEGTSNFLERLALDRTQNETFTKHSLYYQLEELAVFELLAERKYSANVYPGAHLPVMKRIVAGEYPGFIPLLEELTLVELRFRSTL